MSKQLIDKALVKEARELQDFFTNTYAEQALEDAISTGNNDVIRAVISEFRDKRWVIEEMEDQSSEKDSRRYVS